VKRLVVTADDFGLAVPVNEAVEDAHRRGILTAASLMVTAPAFEDAVERARRLPTLGVGLHLTLVDGVPALPPGEVPDLVGADGLFTSDSVGKGAAIYLKADVRRQMLAEVRAQFERFRRTGLPLDHVNGHHHYHLHPSIVGAIVSLAGEFGVRAVRLPNEPLWRSWRAMGEGFGRRFAAKAVHVGPVTAMRRKLRAAGLISNDIMLGLADSGRMTRARMLGYIAALPEGDSELYCHPATRRWPGPFAPRADYLCVEEYQALVDPDVVAAVRASGAALVPFAALAAGPLATRQRR
jgi:hopanoid biosynthesis associated protein HpnK